MTHPLLYKIFLCILLFLCLWLTVRYLLPLSLPFLLGFGLALCAEPLTAVCQNRLRLRRGAAAGIGVSSALVMVSCLILLVGCAALRELGTLAKVLPDLGSRVRLGVTQLQDWLLRISYCAPESVQPLVTKSVLRLTDSGSRLMDEALGQLPRVASGMIGHMSDGFLVTGTALLSAFLISVRLPAIRAWLARSPLSKGLPMLRKLRRTLLQWLSAQAKLALVTFLVVTVGLIVLAVPYAPVWAIFIALVDAVPLLGTGIVLAPWALVSFLQGNSLRALGLLITFAAATVSRTVLEPKLVGKHLGLDPLAALVCLYLGYRIWGIPGMILSPIVAVTARELLQA